MKKSMLSQLGMLEGLSLSNSLKTAVTGHGIFLADLIHGFVTQII